MKFKCSDRECSQGSHKTGSKLPQNLILTQQIGLSRIIIPSIRIRTLYRLKRWSYSKWSSISLWRIWKLTRKTFHQMFRTRAGSENRLWMSLQRQDPTVLRWSKGWEIIQKPQLSIKMFWTCLSRARLNSYSLRMSRSLKSYFKQHLLLNFLSFETLHQSYLLKQTLELLILSTNSSLQTTEFLWLRNNQTLFSMKLTALLLSLELIKKR